jgi:hypothetical protein
MSPLGQKKGPAEAEPHSAICIQQFAIDEKWAHQDSNLEQAGYEPAALTVELWAPSEV